MERGKIIVIEGTDGSGKRTQVKLLQDKLISQGVLCKTISFPRYDTPTGKIISECYLGKGKGTSWFIDPPRLHPKIASLLYAADRFAAKNEIEQTVHIGINLILDRYIESNMAHQGGKINWEDRGDFIKFIQELEYNLLGMPKPDKIIFLHVPTETAVKLREKRNEKPDAHESDIMHLKNAERNYLDLAEKFSWEKISCVSNGELKHPEEIHEEIYEKVSKMLNR